MQRPLFTSETRCSVRECVAAWSHSAHSEHDAQLGLARASTAAGAVTVGNGMLDADGNTIWLTLCKDCHAGFQSFYGRAV